MAAWNALPQASHVFQIFLKCHFLNDLHPALFHLNWKLSHHHTQLSLPTSIFPLLAYYITSQLLHLLFIVHPLPEEYKPQKRTGISVFLLTAKPWEPKRSPSAK